MPWRKFLEVPFNIFRTIEPFHLSGCDGSFAIYASKTRRRSVTRCSQEVKAMTRQGDYHRIRPLWRSKQKRGGRRDSRLWDWTSALKRNKKVSGAHNLGDFFVVCCCLLCSKRWQKTHSIDIQRQMVDTHKSKKNGLTVRICAVKPNYLWRRKRDLNPEWMSLLKMKPYYFRISLK